jgi:hypothetical protein
MDSIGVLGTRFGALASVLLLAVEARPQEGMDPLVLVCDQAAATLAIGSEGPPSALPSGSAITRVDWARLIEYGRDENPAGDPLRTGSGTATHRCGDLVVSVQGGFLNSNAVGELGALEFPIASVRRGDVVIVPPTALAECEQANPRFELHGDCPGGYAESIRVRSSREGWKVTYERAYLDPEREERTETKEETVRAASAPAVKR